MKQTANQNKVLMKCFKDKYKNPHCHHIASIYQHKEPIPQHQGNLFLSGYGGLKKNIVEQYGITAAITIMDKWTYQYDQIDKLVFQNNLLGNHKWIDLEDCVDQSIQPHFKDALYFISENLKTKNVLVHCHMGISRSATMVLAFLMEHFRMNLNQAYQHTVSIRDTIQPNQSFWKALQKLQKDLMLGKI